MYPSLISTFPFHAIVCCPLVAEAVLRPLFNELSFNLESFNPAFTSCLLMVRGTHHTLNPPGRPARAARNACAHAVVVVSRGGRRLLI